jgi:hypothetical protein
LIENDLANASWQVANGMAVNFWDDDHIVMTHHYLPVADDPRPMIEPRTTESWSLVNDRSSQSGFVQNIYRTV